MKEIYDCIRLRHRAKTGSNKTYMLPDGNIISDVDGCFHRAGVLYQPSFISTEACGFHDTSFQYNTRCDADIGENLYVNVLLSSGTTMFQRIVERMTKVLTSLAPSKMKIKQVLRFSMDWLSPEFAL